jgi:EREBP-like factor
MIFLRYSFRRVAAELPTTPEPCAVVRSSPKPGPRQLTERDLWQEKKPKRGGGGGRRWFLAEEDEDFEDFQGEPKESDLELGDGEDDNIVEIKPFTTKRTSSKGIGIIARGTLLSVCMCTFRA